MTKMQAHTFKEKDAGPLSWPHDTISNSDYVDQLWIIVSTIQFCDKLVASPSILYMLWSWVLYFCLPKIASPSLIY